MTTSDWLTSIGFFVTIGTTLIGIISSHFLLKKQIKNSPQIAKEYLSVLLQLLENLQILETAMIYRGKFCYIIEHRCPTLSLHDGESDYSYAERAHLFLIKVRELIKNCREIIFLTPTKDLPQTIEIIRDIKKYLIQEERKTHTTLLNGISEQDHWDRNQCDNYARQFNSFYQHLDDLIEKELPNLRK